jgi:Gpi18-like mannosyltransferase
VSSASQARFLLRYFNLLGALVKGIVFLISFSACPLLVRNLFPNGVCASGFPTCQYLCSDSLIASVDWCRSKYTSTLF